MIMWVCVDVCASLCQEYDLTPHMLRLIHLSGVGHDNLNVFSMIISRSSISGGMPEE